MLVTIIRADNFVSIDGIGYAVDCSSLPAGVHAVQWGGDHGEVEYAPLRCDHCGVRSKKPNEWITDIKPYAHLIEQWNAVKAAVAAAREQREQAAVAQLESERARREAQKAEMEVKTDATGP